MDVLRLTSSEQSLTCDLCGRGYPAAEVAMRGRLNFCRSCAYERAAECLTRLQGSKGKRSGAAILVGLIGLGMVAGMGWWALKTLPLREMVRDGLPESAPQPSSANEPSKVASVTPSPAAAQPVVEAGTAPAPPTPTAASTPQLQPILADSDRRSVVDAGHLHLLFVTRPGTDGRMGLSSQVFATREAPHQDSAKLMTEVGSQMATSFDEGLRYVRKLPRGWERDFSIRLSFEDKFTSKDGGSAGTGFTIVMLAAIQAIELDPSVAVTGDLTVDGTVQPVGAVVDKLRGAIAGKCKVTLIPERNARDVVDLALIDGTSPLWETQIFSIGTIDQALGHARRDRGDKLKNAMARFDALRARLPVVVTPNYLQSPIVQAELKEVLQAAPNHLSAATLLHAAENQLPAELSLNRSVDEILATSHFFVDGVLNPDTKTPRVSNNGGNGGITVFPEREFGECVRNLQRLTPILDRRSLELKSCCMAYAGAIRAAWTYQPADPSARRTWYQMSEVVRQERILQQQAAESLDSARSRLLLAMRKLDTDGSMVSEMLKK